MIVYIWQCYFLSSSHPLLLLLCRQVWTHDSTPSSVLWFFRSLVVDLFQKFPVFFIHGCSANGCDFGVPMRGDEVRWVSLCSIILCGLLNLILRYENPFFFYIWCNAIHHIFLGKFTFKLWLYTTFLNVKAKMYSSNIVQFSSVTQSCPTLCDPMNRSTPGLPVHHQLPEFTQTHVHWVGDAIQPSHPLSSPSPPALNPSQHQSLFQWVNSSHEVAKVWQ